MFFLGLTLQDAITLGTPKNRINKHDENCTRLRFWDKGTADDNISCPSVYRKKNSDIDITRAITYCLRTFQFQKISANVDCQNTLDISQRVTLNSDFKWSWLNFFGGAMNSSLATNGRFRFWAYISPPCYLKFKALVSNRLYHCDLYSFFIIIIFFHLPYAKMSSIIIFFVWIQISLSWLIQDKLYFER